VPATLAAVAVIQSTSGAAWGSWLVRRHYLGDGFSDAGEHAAVEFLGAWVDGARVLDLGVGAGRTTSFLAPRASTYLGIDVSRKMVRSARRRIRASIDAVAPGDRALVPVAVCRQRPQLSRLPHRPSPVEGRHKLGIRC
jgi:SAM-dependent methyltransferase